MCECALIKHAASCCCRARIELEEFPKLNEPDARSLVRELVVEQINADEGYDSDCPGITRLFWCSYNAADIDLLYLLGCSLHPELIPMIHLLKPRSVAVAVLHVKT